jgi:ketosteroid isomerase-like protein
MAILQLCTDDVMWIPPNFPAIVGKEAITQWLSGAEVEIRDLHIANLNIDGAGSVAYLTCNYSTAYITGRSEVMAKADGTHLWILRKLADGEWKVAIITWSSWEAGR